jgi:hypothetical protein
MKMDLNAFDDIQRVESQMDNCFNYLETEYPQYGEFSDMWRAVSDKILDQLMEEVRRHVTENPTNEFFTLIHADPGVELVVEGFDGFNESIDLRISGSGRCEFDGVKGSVTLEDSVEATIGTISGRGFCRGDSSLIVGRIGSVGCLDNSSVVAGSVDGEQSCKGNSTLIVGGMRIKGEVVSMTKDERIERARNESTPAELLTRLAQDEHWHVRYAVAANPHTPAEVLSELARDKGLYVRGAVALNPHTPVEVLTKLAGDEEWDVRYCVAKHPNTPAEVLAELAKDERWDVRKGVAANRNTPAEVLSELAQDAYEDVRQAVAKNANAPKPEEEGIRI